MSSAGVILLVFVILATDFVIFWGIAQAIGLVIKPLADAFPPVEPAPDAITRKFQSFSFGIANFGGGVHVAVDERYLHLRPVSFARFFGLRPMSIPWEKIEPRPKPLLGRGLRVRVGKTDITGPAWCLSLAGRDGVGLGGPSGNASSEMSESGVPRNP